MNNAEHHAEHHAEHQLPNGGGQFGLGKFGYLTGNIAAIGLILFFFWNDHRRLGAYTDYLQSDIKEKMEQVVSQQQECLSNQKRIMDRLDRIDRNKRIGVVGEAPEEKQ